MSAIRERRETIRATIQGLLPDLNMIDCFWAGTTCPNCGDDHDYFFVIDRDYYKVDERGYVWGGYICLDCGFSNAGGMHRSDLPDDFDKNYQI